MAYKHLEDIAKGECVCRPPVTAPSVVLVRNQECVNSVWMQWRSSRDDQWVDGIPLSLHSMVEKRFKKKREYALVSNSVYATKTSAY